VRDRHGPRYSWIAEQQRCTGESTMKVHVKHALKTDVASALKLCTYQKHQ